MEYTWCPIFGQGGSSFTEILNAQQIGDLDLDFNLHLSWFPDSDPQKFLSNQKQVKVKSLLASAGIKDINTVASDGCVIYVKFHYGTSAAPCPTGDNCVPNMSVVRLDKNPPGFKMRRSNYYRGNGTVASQSREMRDVSRVFGIRVIAQVSGRGETFSLTMAMLQIACALAMAQCVYIAADVFTIFLNLKAL